MKWAAGILLLGLAVLLWWSFAGSPPPVDTSVPGPTTPGPAIGAPARDGPRDATADRSAAGGGGANDERREAVDAPRGAGGGPEGATLRGRVVDAATREPLTGCKVDVDGWAQPEAGSKRVVKAAAPGQTTGPDGAFRFRFEARKSHRYELRIGRPGYIGMVGAWLRLEPGGELSLGDIGMTTGFTVNGRVVDTKDNALGSAEIQLNGSRVEGPSSYAPVKPDSYHRATTAPDGSFAMRVAPGRFDVFLPKHQVVSPRAITVRDVSPTIEVVVAHPSEIDTIEGKVTDTSGAAVGGVLVSHLAGTSFRPGTETGKDGTFAIERPIRDPADPVRLLVSSNAHEHFTSENLIPWGTEDVAVVLRPCPTFELRVVAAGTRTPVEEFGVRYVRGDRLQGSLPDRIHDSGHHAGGLLVLSCLRRGEWRIVVEPGSKELCESPPLRVDLHGDSPVPREVELHPRVSRTVRVERQDGSVVAGTRVELLEALDDRPLTLRSTPVRWGGYVFPGGGLSVASGTTGAAGTAVLAAPPDRELTLQVLGPGHEPALRRGLFWVESPDPVVVVVRAGARLLGTIGPPEALARLTPTQKIRAAYPAGPHRERAMRSFAPTVSLARSAGGKRESYPPGFAASVAIGADGGFEFDGVPPGEWDVELNVREFVSYSSSRSSSRTIGTVELEEGKTTRFAGKAPAAPDRARLSGTVYHNGERCANTAGVLMCVRSGGIPGMGRFEPFRTDGEGRFEKDVVPGEYRLGIHPEGVRPSPYSPTIPSTSTVEVAKGQTRDAVYRIESAALTLEVSAPGGEAAPNVRLLLCRDAIRWFRSTSATDAHGRVTIRDVPLGPLEVRLTRDAKGALDERPSLGRVSVEKSGSRAAFTIPAR